MSISDLLRRLGLYRLAGGAIVKGFPFEGAKKAGMFAVGVFLLCLEEDLGDLEECLGIPLIAFSWNMASF